MIQRPRNTPKAAIETNTSTIIVVRLPLEPIPGKVPFVLRGLGVTPRGGACPTGVPPRPRRRKTPSGGYSPCGGSNTVSHFPKNATYPRALAHQWSTLTLVHRNRTNDLVHEFRRLTKLNGASTYLLGRDRSGSYPAECILGQSTRRRGPFVWFAPS